MGNPQLTHEDRTELALTVLALLGWLAVTLELFTGVIP